MRRIRLLLLAAAFSGAAGSASAYNVFNEITLSDEGEYSAITIVFSEPVKEYSIKPNMEELTVEVVVPKSSLSVDLYPDELKDSRVKKITADRDKDGSAVAAILLRDVKTSIYHSLAADGKSLTLRLKGRTNLMLLDKDAKGAERRKALREQELALVKEMEVKEKFAGRDLYVDALATFQKNVFPEAEQKLKEFMKLYPDSMYKEKAMLMYAEAIYRLSKKERERARDSIEAFRLASATFPKSDAMFRTKLRIADLYQDMNLNVEAEAVYEGIIKDDPEGKYTLSAMRGKANIFLKEEKYDLAYNELEKILLLYPAAKEARQARFRIAEAFYLKKRYETSLRIFEDSNEKWPSYMRANPDILQHFADNYYILGKYDKAFRIYMELVNLFPDKDEGRYAVNKLADLYVMRNDPKAAIKMLEPQIRQVPETPQGLDSRLRLAAIGHAPMKLIDPETKYILKVDDYFDPLATYNYILRKHGKTPQAKEALYQKARLMRQEKRYVESILSLKQMMKDFPETEFDEKIVTLIKDNLYSMIHNFHDQDGFYTVLATYYDNFDPFLADIADAEVTMKIAEAFSELGLFDKALARFNDAEKLDRLQILRERIRLGKGLAYAGAGRLQEAEETLAVFTDELDTSVYAPDAVHLLGDVFYTVGKPTDAIKAYRKAIAIAPTHDRVSRSAYNMGLAQKGLGNYADAVQSFALSIDKNDKLVDLSNGTKGEEWHIEECHYQLIESAYLARDYANAAAYANVAMSRYPDSGQNSWAKYVKSDSQLRLNQDEEAVGTLKKIAKDEPTTVYGKVAASSVDNIEWKEKNKEFFPY